MLECMPNLKHKQALSMIYGLGLRRSELLNLRLQDIDSKRMLVKILNAKGNKDRSFSNIQKNHTFTLHCLIRSYATHLLESGTDLRYIQELLGHKSSRTTEIYTFVSMNSLQNIKSPLDDFKL